MHSITLKANYLKEFDVKKMDAVEKYSGSMVANSSRTLSTQCEGAVEGENMLWVNSLHELTGGHELKRAPWMTHDNMANHN